MRHIYRILSILLLLSRNLVIYLSLNHPIFYYLKRNKCKNAIRCTVIFAIVYSAKAVNKYAITAQINITRINAKLRAKKPANKPRSSILSSPLYSQHISLHCKLCFKIQPNSLYNNRVR